MNFKRECEELLARFDEKSTSARVWRQALPYVLGLTRYAVVVELLFILRAFAVIFAAFGQGLGPAAAWGVAGEFAGGHLLLLSIAWSLPSALCYIFGGMLVKRFAETARAMAYSVLRAEALATEKDGLGGA